MPQQPTPMVVESNADYARIRYRDPERFEEISTPVWAETAAESVVDGSGIRMGKRSKHGDWEPQSVLIPNPADEEQARRQAEEILQRID